MYMGNICNIKLRTGQELITEVLEDDEAKDFIDTGEYTMLSHPIIISTHPIYDPDSEEFIIRYSYAPLLAFSASALYPIETSELLVISELHDSHYQHYIEMVIDMYAWLHIDEDDLEEPEEQGPTLH
jgi:hypothetical protein